jgi:hypothetical protein
MHGACDAIFILNIACWEKHMCSNALKITDFAFSRKFPLFWSIFVKTRIFVSTVVVKFDRVCSNHGSQYASNTAVWLAAPIALCALSKHACKIYGVA